MFLTCPNLTALRHIRHGFFTRKGGNSTGLYASLNCGYGSGDDIETVGANRAHVAREMGVTNAALITVHQIHSNDCITLKAPWHYTDAPQGDAMATDIPGIALGILAADCQPILFADSTRGVIGAAHAGWKGAFTGVIENTLAAMQSLGAKLEDITATIGPSIAQNSYEVGAEFYERFVQASAANSAYFIPSLRAGHYLFGMNAYTQDRLHRTGIGTINLLACDTYAHTDDFFSFRRATLQRESVYGRHISVIALV